MTDTKGRGRRGYHHGNLRAALIEATRALIAEKGVAGVTIADAARRAGVSAAAPYRHFESRDALIGATAEAGFARFADRLTAAWDDGRPSPLAAFEATGRAYLAFAREEPEYYAAMFDPSLPPAESADAGRAFEILRRAAERLIESLPPERRPPVHMVALHVWALSHGIAGLFAVPGGGARSPIPAEELLESAIGVYLRGLGLLDRT